MQLLVDASLKEKKEGAIKMAKKEKCYVVISKDKKYTYGAFSFTPEGEKQARIYAKQLTKDGGEFLVVEK